MPADDAASSSTTTTTTGSTITSRMSRFVKHVFLSVNCFVCVPMYSMAISLTLYSMFFYWGTSCVWLRTLLFLYCPCYCILDPRPTLQTKEEESTTKASTKASRWFTWKYSWTQACRSVWAYRGVAEYFPITLHKTVDLLPDSKRQKPFIFLYHPHGVISMGCNIALGLNGCDFDLHFPGIKRHGITLNVSFWSPVFREWMLALGYKSANKMTLVETLTKQKRSIVLVPGGAAEAIHAHRSNFRLHLKHRKGFIRLALETGAIPVPCLGFGENGAFETYYPGREQSLSSDTIEENHHLKSSSFLYWQQRLYKLTSFSTPILTQLLPNRTPIHVVVGAPVVFTKTASVEECHQQYIQAVRQLYEQHKDKYGYKSIDIEIV